MNRNDSTLSLSLSFSHFVFCFCFVQLVPTNYYCCSIDIVVNYYASILEINGWVREILRLNWSWSPLFSFLALDGAAFGFIRESHKIREEQSILSIEVSTWNSKKRQKSNTKLFTNSIPTISYIASCQLSPSIQSNLTPRQPIKSNCRTAAVLFHPLILFIVQEQYYYDREKCEKRQTHTHTPKNTNISVVFAVLTILLQLMPSWSWVYYSHLRRP